MGDYKELLDQLENAAGEEIEKLTQIAADILRDHHADALPDLLGEGAKGLIEALDVLSEHEGGGASLFQQAKVQKEVYVASLKQLDYEEASGTMVSRERVTEAVFNFARGARDAILSIPDRVGAEAAAEVVSYLAPLIRDVAGEKKANAILGAISLPELTRIMYRLWDREGRHVLEHLTPPPEETPATS